MDIPDVVCTVQGRDLAEVGMDDIWHVDEDGYARRIGGFIELPGHTLVESLIANARGQGRLIYDPNRSDFILDLILH